jgi:RimJ/RimL family protein N-acetyltransferase
MNVLITPRLTMRPPAMPDAEDIALWLSDCNVARMLGTVPHPYRLSDAFDWIASVTGDPSRMVYTIHRERLIGVVSLEGDPARPRLGYWLASRWHGRGFMTEAADALLAHAFATRDIDAVSSSVFTDNPASLRVQLKLGFRVTGVGEAFSRARNAGIEKWLTHLAPASFAGAGHHETRSAA